jgi:hypothetical protein
MRMVFEENASQHTEAGDQTAIAEFALPSSWWHAKFLASTSLELESFAGLTLPVFAAAAFQRRKTYAVNN